MPKRIAAHHAREKFARLVGRSLAQQREHRGREQEVEAQKEENLDRRQLIGHGKDHHFHPSGETAREIVDEQREEIEIDRPAKEVMPHLAVRTMHHQHRSDGQQRHENHERGLSPQGATDAQEELLAKVCGCETHESVDGE